MRPQFDSSIVRIYSNNGGVIGAGFLVSQKYILTCAHVVADALGDTRNITEMLGVEITLDFPLVPDRPRFTAKVVFWRPVNPDEQVEDIAGLELENSPQVAQKVPLVTSDDWQEHSFRVYGFPAAQPHGVWATGVLRGRTAKDWVQLEDVKQPGFRLEPGFSGAPIWDEKLQGVAGIAVAAEMRRPDAKVAFMIPSHVLIKAWPAIADCPYRGLSAFREEDAKFFFGRDEFIKQLVESVKRKPLVTVIGASGSGKSSVVFAGLIPQLRLEKNWLIVDFRPGDHPFRNLVTKLVSLLDPENSSSEQLITQNRLVQEFQQDVSGLKNIVTSILNKNSGIKLLLIADQFEELYTLCQEKERNIFIEQLLLTIKQIENFKIVLTLRADFFKYAISERSFAEALQDANQILGPMNRQELKDVIEKPAQLLQLTIERGLTESILDAVNVQPGNLPILEFTLTKLWEKRQNGQLTHQAYDEIDRLEKALAKYAEDKYQSFSEKDQLRVQRVFIQLVRPGEGTEDTRRLATREEIGADNWDLVTQLASHNFRLVVINKIKKINEKEETDQETVEIIHEALIREWKTLQTWMENSRAFRIWQEQLKVKIKEWESVQKDNQALLQRVFLPEAEKWLQERKDEMSLSEQNFIQQSSKFEDNRKFRTWQEQLKVKINEWESVNRDYNALLRGTSLVIAEEWLQERKDEMSLSEQDFIQQSSKFEANREFCTWQEQLKVKINEWESAHRESNLLLKGTSLVIAGEKLQQRGSEMSSSEQNFINQSLEFEAKKKKEQKRRRMLVNWGLAITSLFSIGVISYYFWPSKKLSVVIVTSENVPYEQIMIQAFRDRLINEPKIKLIAPPPEKGCLESPDSVKIPEEPCGHLGKLSGKELWNKITKDIAIRYKDQNIDYIVTAGSFATKAIRDADLVKKLGAKGQIFLGVTDPISSGIVTSLDNRYENSNIAGVRYGTGGLDYGKEIASLFPPDQKLVFVYDQDTPQDTYVAKDIDQLKNNGDDRFINRPFPRPVEPTDLGDPKNPNDAKEVYFAWYGLDNILNSVGGAELLRDKWVIPSTYAPENVKYAGIVVSVYDKKVGELGAEILLKNFYHPEKKLGHEPVGMPPFHTWLDCQTIKDKGIKLSPAVSKRTTTRDDTCRNP
ncbi:trypsin-like peptidase domain-containing protein [Aphanizomenon sp. CS-733/32]|uniref:nSTAND1 domain-containing NTPase n=1 Tax=Aphanizomenon sp. CS-733/32 TaxID=3021715 RepID=UPI00232B6FF3|nr:trypsin-like peptidase domain-containing protein [Aphanizomenon sp. CS-733/32]MDB9307569.1 trypsin-like peptidase domain-containing protein [Aphanizomenon sp. CS-733/32]